jgi:hypothetical protein
MRTVVALPTHVTHVYACSATTKACTWHALGLCALVTDASPAHGADTAAALAAAYTEPPQRSSHQLATTRPHGMVATAPAAQQGLATTIPLPAAAPVTTTCMYTYMQALQ